MKHFHNFFVIGILLLCFVYQIKAEDEEDLHSSIGKFIKNAKKY